MNKLKQIKEAIKQTPPDRLAKIEYQSHFMQILGVSLVCGILIWQGYWWIIFAFIFSIGISLSQGISSYQKYHAIKDIIGDTYDVKKDKSFTRKRDYINTKVYGPYMKWISMITSILFAFIYVPYDTWYQKIIFGLSIMVFHIIFYFHVIFFIANKHYRKMKK